MVRLEIKLLGEIEVSLDGQLVKFPTQKAKELFAYLVLHHQSAHPRAPLAGLLWPETDEARAKANLRQTLARLRKMLGPENELWIVASPGALRFHAKDAWTDVAEFERLLQSPDRVSLDQAVALYRGPFLSGFYEDWVLIEQERLQTLYREALEQLAELHRANGAYEKAIPIWKQALQAVPWHERAHRELMTLYALAGDRAAALRQFSEYENALQRELSATPLPETRVLYEQLLRGAPLKAAREEPLVLPRETPFVGRERELATLRAIWQNVLQGQGQAVLIGGEVGVGKTTCVEHFLSVIGASPLRGAAPASGRGLPYQPLLQAARMGMEGTTTEVLARLPILWRSELAQFFGELHERFPELSPNPELDPAPGKTRWFDALTGFFSLLAHERPLVLFLDDLHWADDATLEYLGHLVGAKQLASPLLLIGTYRNDDALPGSRLRTWLDRLGPGRAYHPLTLSRLSPEETDLFLARWLGVGTRDAASLLYDETEGNPFFLRELTHSLIRSGALGQDDAGQWKLAVSEIGTEHLPESLRELMRASLRRAPERAQQLLALGAVIGRAFDLSVLKLVLRQPEEKLLDNLDRLRRIGLIVEREGRYQFYHELLRQVLYDELSADRKRLWHREIGQALEELYPQELDTLAGELAEHFEQAQQREKAGTYAMQAGMRAQKVYAYGEALKFFTRALKLFERLQPLSLAQRQKKLTLLSAYTSGFPTISDLKPALEEMEAAVSEMMALAQELGDDTKRCETYVQQARVELARGRREAARNALHQALSISQAVSKSALAKFLEQIGRLYRQLGEYGEALPVHHRLAQIGAELGDCDVQGKAQADIAVIQLFVGQLAEARQNMERARQLVEATGNRRLQASVLNNLGVILRELGRYESAQSCYEQAYQLMSALGDQRGAGIVLINWGGLASDQGRYEEALGYFERVLSTLHLPGLKGLEIEAYSEKGRAHLARGDLGLALEFSGRAVHILDSEGGISTEAERFYFTHYKILRAQQKTDEARIYLQKAYERLRSIADHISDEALRRSFLENVSINREIIEAWEAAQQPH